MCRIELCRGEKQVGQMSDRASQACASYGFHSEHAYLFTVLAAPQIEERTWFRHVRLLELSNVTSVFS